MNKGETINAARVVRDRPYWAVIDQQHVLARFVSRKRAQWYRDTVNERPDQNWCLGGWKATP